eukprot:scaffold27546_cov54-Phaeocystis_antarctica.AAC.1
MRCVVRGCGPADGGDGVQRAVEAQLQIRGSTGVERTRNISCMLVTLEVSKLSGWLNADAYCRGSKGGHVRYGTMCGPADGGDGVQRAVEGLTANWEQSRCGAHIEHLLHGCDAG